MLSPFARQLAKSSLLGLMRSLGGFSLASQSRWRSQRLLILCYHGISTDDEHEWDPELYMPASLFRSRMEQIKAARCTVLDLAQALRHLERGDLPPRAVCITFDDGTADFYHSAFPILRDCGYPVTLYLTTSYLGRNQPVFPPILSYVLWKGRNATLTSSDLPVLTGAPDLRTREGRRSVAASLTRRARERQWSPAERDAWVSNMAGKIGVDYSQLLEKRVLQLMHRDEVTALSSEGVAIELHTHRHRVPADRDSFRREITDNREAIEKLTGVSPHHFCYPSGDYSEEFFPWLRELGIRSATTCVPGFVTGATDAYLLPRLVDTCGLTALAFESWLTGPGAWLQNLSRLA